MSAIQTTRKNDLGAWKPFSVRFEEYDRGYADGYKDGSGKIAADVVALKEQYDKGYAAGMKKIHFIGKHGAITYLTKQGTYCAECGKKVNT